VPGLSAYDSSVFLNFPFTDDYAPVLRAILFAVVDCGFRPRCALELEDSGQIRLQKIERLIEECRFGIHDLSNMELDPKSGLPRFNMPFELGLFLGAKRYSDDRSQRDKRLIILDREKFRYQQAISDISGQDILSHEGDPKTAIRRVRNWLNTQAPERKLGSARFVIARYEQYEMDLPAICDEIDYDPADLTFIDLWNTMGRWQTKNGRNGAQP
jgi:hypothetical protein